MRQKLEALGDGYTETNQTFIKRRLIPVEMHINEKGQYQTFQQKIPFHVQKIVGVIIISDTPSQMVFPTRIYLGSAPDTVITPSLVYGLRNDIATGETQYFSIHVAACEKLYFAQPHTLGKPYLFLNGRTGKFKDPVTISLTDFWTGCEENYWVWESKYTGFGTVELCVKADSWNEYDDY
ncbi:hypothetical protein C9994_00160 [Marivirga lumbricoides]|uniref:Uncharacterized protein n=1 Tax=Marivirga lumbricoides TaxID=1046115 RepID=A0A2T4DVZ6_9BACT|nr:hypothetical protein C9994_00160 [Marivirga lumbricoides]